MIHEFMRIMRGEAWARAVDEHVAPHQTQVSIGQGALGTLSNYVVRVIVLVTIILTTLCVSGRLYTRVRVTRQPGWDDLCVSIGFLFALGVSISLIIMSHNGLTRHIGDVPAEQLAVYFKAAYVNLGSFLMCAAFVKVAMLLQFLRLFDPRKPVHRVVKILLGIVVLWGIAFFVIAWFPCVPVAKAWDIGLPGHCFGLGTGPTDLRQFLVTLLCHAVTNMVLDGVILGLAGYMMWQLHPARSLKLRIAILLFVGVIVNLCALARTAIIGYMLDCISDGELNDPTYEEPWGVLLLALETNLMTICASVPVFWAPFELAVKDKWNSIFITNEVTVISTPRHLRGPGSNGEDQRKLTRHPSFRADSLSSEPDFELSGLPGGDHKGETSKARHYDDDYVKMSVDPLRAEKQGGATVRSEPRIGRRSTSNDL